MVNVNTMDSIMRGIHTVLETHRLRKELTREEEISLRRAFDVAADKWIAIESREG